MKERSSGLSSDQEIMTVIAPELKQQSKAIAPYLTISNEQEYDSQKNNYTIPLETNKQLTPDLSIEEIIEIIKASELELLEIHQSNRIEFD
ncbi:MAG: hypothetical protein QNJ72_23080 [Pleurocapsa sp. MO_226.B13]|nr:hypothetical protein [Pleurocapsa sp. MO_226.B13]